MHRAQLHNSFALVTNQGDMDILSFWKLMQLRYYQQHSISVAVTSQKDRQKFVKLLLLRLVLLHNKKTAVTNWKDMGNLFV